MRRPPWREDPEEVRLIRGLTLVRGVPQRIIAERLSVSEATVSYWHSRKRRCSQKQHQPSGGPRSPR